MNNSIKGYKVFKPDWTCSPNGKPFQYEVGKTYEENVEPMVCDRGFHFCERAADCFKFYDFDPKNKVAEVLALGDVASDGSKSCTNRIQIVREISWAELLEMVNTGKGCAGLCNSGDWNSGNCNSGNWNSGYWNSGNRNSGNYNSGNCNSGSQNSGDWNSGNCNSGNCNSGDWNRCFNTESPKIYFFNKPSDWTYNDWFHSDARRILNRIPMKMLEYRYFSDMTDEEKAEHPEANTTGGYLRTADNTDKAQKWWNELSDGDKAIITALPNFDKAIFREITGINIDEKEQRQ